MSAHDLSKEKEVMEKIEEILTRQHNDKERISALNKMMKPINEEFAKEPRRVLDGMYEKLTLLQGVGWDVKRQMKLYESLKRDLTNITKQMQAFQWTSYDNAYDAIDDYTELNADSLYLLAEIANLRDEVDNMCTNYILTMKKLF